MSSAVARYFHPQPEMDAKPTRITRAGLLRIARCFVPHGREALLIVLCILVAAFLGNLPPLFTRHLIDTAIPGKSVRGLAIDIAVMIGAPLLAGLIGVGQNYLAVRVGQDVMAAMRDDMYERVLSQSLRFYTNTKAGEILSRVQNDVGGIQGVVSGTLVAAVTNVVQLGMTLVIIFALNWRLSLVAIAILPFFALPTRRVGQMRQKIAKTTQEKVAAMTALIQETLSVSGHLMVRLFGARRRELERFRAINAEVRALNIRQNLVGRWLFFSLLLFASVGPALIFGFGGWLAIHGALTIGTIVAFVAYLGRLYGPVSGLVSVHVDVVTSFALFDRIFAYLDLVPEVAERKDAVTFARAQGRLAFEHVSFSYEGAKVTLDDISFEASPGQLVALVGPSGSGKTTITYLASRLYDPAGGVVRLDGHDLRDLTLDSISAAVGKVTQESHLFHESVLDNVRYAKQDATLEEVQAACREAQIHDVIAALPQGYDTVVGERGYKLSGGEKQRVAIARVILKDPRLLILDEATSSLDSRSEALIQEAIGRLLRGRTSLVIAHRLSTILAADSILVMDGGHIVERGTHAELLRAGGLYAKLYEEQFRAAATATD